MVRARVKCGVVRGKGRLYIGKGEVWSGEGQRGSVW